MHTDVHHDLVSHIYVSSSTRNADICCRYKDVIVAVAALQCTVYNS